MNQRKPSLLHTHAVCSLHLDVLPQVLAPLGPCPTVSPLHLHLLTDFVRWFPWRMRRNKEKTFWRERRDETRDVYCGFAMSIASFDRLGALPDVRVPPRVCLCVCPVSVPFICGVCHIVEIYCPYSLNVAWKSASKPEHDGPMCRYWPPQLKSLNLAEVGSDGDNSEDSDGLPRMRYHRSNSAESVPPPPPPMPERSSPPPTPAPVIRTQPKPPIKRGES